MVEKVECSEFQNPEPQRINLNDIYKSDLRPGTSIEGIALPQDLDRSIVSLSQRLIGLTPFGERPIRTIYSDNIKRMTERIALSKTFKTYAEKKKFFGQIKNYSILILPTEEPFPTYGYGSDPIIYKQAEGKLNFVVQAEMHSTGSGNIGEIYQLCDMDCALHPNSLDPWIHFNARPGNAKQTERAIADRLSQSKSDYYWSTLLALRQASSAGLGSLGDRS